MGRWNRWVVYQRERFPLAAHVPLIAAFSGSAVCFSSLLRGHAAPPRLASLTVAFLTSLLFFLQLRIADEFKDRDADARFRPYRPVPRGLVTLRELAWLGIAAGGMQLALALWLEPSLVWLLIVTWSYLALMTREFFAARWLRAHPVLYMTSHMLIVPLIDLYATACDWRVAGDADPPSGLFWFLAVSFLNGLVVEIGRKTRAADDEEEGVETYSALWGKHAAAQAWLAAVAVTAFAAWQASIHIGTNAAIAVLMIVLTTGCAIVAWTFVRSTKSGSGRWLEATAGVWTILLYVGLGAAPLALTVWRGVQ